MTVVNCSFMCIFPGGCILAVALAVSVQCYFHRNLPNWLPQSFTLGEAAVIAQAAAAFLLFAVRLYITTVSA